MKFFTLLVLFLFPFAAQADNQELTGDTKLACEAIALPLIRDTSRRVRPVPEPILRHITQKMERHREVPPELFEPVPHGGRRPVNADAR